MQIAEIMTSRIVTVTMDDSLTVVKEIFDNLKFHHLLVTESEKLVGILSDRDLLKAMSPFVGTGAENSRDTATLNRKVHQIMTRKPVTLKPCAQIDDAIELFISQRVSCVPVIDDGGRAVGILSWRDVMKSPFIKQAHSLDS